MFLRFNPFNEINSIFHDVDNLFRRTLREAGVKPVWDVPTYRFTLGNSSARTLSTTSGFVPPLDIYAENGKFVIRCELPGVDPKKVNLTISDNQLKISGEKESHRERNDGTYFFSEAVHGQFERIVNLPQGVNTEQVQATYKNGILEISMPADIQAEPRKIKIESADQAKQMHTTKTEEPKQVNA